MHRSQTGTLSGVVKSTQLVIPQREIPVAPFHIGAGALEDLGELGRLLLQPALFSRMQLPEYPTRANRGVRMRSASSRSGAPSRISLVAATRSR